MNEFKKFAVGHLGMNSLALESYMQVQSSYISPTIIEERPMNVAQMDVFSRLMMDRIIFLGTQINDYTANVIQAQLLFLDSSEPGKDISIYINSPGGSVYAGYGIYDTMQYISPQIQTVVLGQAASAAAVLLAAGSEGKRLALPNARVLIHQPAMEGMQGQASDIEIVANEMDRMRSWLEDTLAAHTGQDREKIHADLERDKILTAAAAKEYGIVDQVLTSRKTPASPHSS